jgi:hypothetical protein
LPYCFVFFHAAELFDCDVLPYDAMKIVTNEVNNHEILRNLLFTASQ